MGGGGLRACRALAFASSSFFRSASAATSSRACEPSAIPDGCGRSAVANGVSQPYGRRSHGRACSCRRHSASTSRLRASRSSLCATWSMTVWRTVDETYDVRGVLRSDRRASCDTVAQHAESEFRVPEARAPLARRRVASWTSMPWRGPRSRTCMRGGLGSVSACCISACARARVCARAVHRFAARTGSCSRAR
jgi:hypothetical protein